VEKRFAGKKKFDLLPSEYWQRQCFLGASLMTPRTSARRHEFGIHTMMWGADYPHGEGTHPYTWQQYRHVFSGLPINEIALLLGENAIKAFGFSPEFLQSIANRIGPSPDDVSRPLSHEEFPPPGSPTMSFARPLEMV
jgi:Amidohydrolase